MKIDYTFTSGPIVFFCFNFKCTEVIGPRQRTFHIISYTSYSFAGWKSKKCIC